MNKQSKGRTRTPLEGGKSNIGFMSTDQLHVRLMLLNEVLLEN